MIPPKRWSSSTCSYKVRLTHLFNLLAKSYSVGVAANDAFLAHIQASASRVKDLRDDVQLVFRELLDALMVSDLGALEPALKLIEYSIEFSKACPDATDVDETFAKVRRIPFVLIWDFIEGRPVTGPSGVEAIWPKVESLREKITAPSLFKHGKLILLRTCNSTLRRLSKTLHTELFGRVLIFLASSYPITEPSAVNKMGHVNSGNQTLLECLEEFRNTSDPLEVQEVEEGEEEEEAASLTVNGISYDTYRMFWELQKLFISDVKEMQGPRGLDNWQAFRRHADVVLTAFEQERFMFSELELKQEMGRWNDARRKAGELIPESTTTTGSAPAPAPVTVAQSKSKKSKSSKQSSAVAAVEGKDEGDGVGAFLGTKYLTSSRLLALQLRDPLLRLQMASQLLFFTHSIRARPPSFQSAEMKADGKDKSLKDAWSGIKADLAIIETRVYSLVSATPPHGASFLSALNRILSRENHWIAWKLNDKCKAFEQDLSKVGGEDGGENRDGMDVEMDEEEGVGVVKGSGGGGASGAKVVAPTYSGNGPYYCNHSLEDVADTVVKLDGLTDSYEDFIEAYVEAEDPECGIDDEYHPKHDAVYCWRARRRMVACSVSVLEHMPAGDVTAGLKHLEAVASGETGVDDIEVVCTIGEDEEQGEGDDGGDGDDMNRSYSPNASFESAMETDSPDREVGLGLLSEAKEDEGVIEEEEEAKEAKGGDKGKAGGGSVTERVVVKPQKRGREEEEEEDEDEDEEVGLIGLVVENSSSPRSASSGGGSKSKKKKKRKG